MINNLSDTEKIVDFFGFRPILSSSIKVTRNCNLHCKHCYVHTNNGEKNIPLSEIKIRNIAGVRSHVIRTIPPACV